MKDIVGISVIAYWHFHEDEKHGINHGRLCFQLKYIFSNVFFQIRQIF